MPATDSAAWQMFKKGAVAAGLVFGSLLIFSEIGDAKIALWIAAAIFLSVVITGPTGGPGRFLIDKFSGALDWASGS